MKQVQKILADAKNQLEDAGLRGGFLVRDLDTGTEIGIEPDTIFPIASLVKLPLALTVLEMIRTGDLDPARTIELLPENRTPGLTGLCTFRYPTKVAVFDLVSLALSISDDTAADALFDICPPRMVDHHMQQLHIPGLRVRHTIRTLYQTLAERLAPHEAHLAHTLAIQAGTPGGGHLIPQLDITQANAGSARSFVNLLEQMWIHSAPSLETASTTKQMMSTNLMKHRLAPDFATGTSRWASKTGTFLNLRHEVGVVEHIDGTRFAVAALTESRVPTATQPVAEQTLGHIARTLHDTIR